MEQFEDRDTERVCEGKRINEIVHRRRSVTADSALRIGRALGMTPEFRLNLQGLYDLDVARASLEVSEIERLDAA